MRIQPQVSRVLEVAEAGCHSLFLVSADLYEPRDSVMQAMEAFGDQWPEMGLGSEASLASRTKFAKPCPCGALWDVSRECVCSPEEVRAYWRAQEPILLAADIGVALARPKADEVRLVIQETCGSLPTEQFSEAQKATVDRAQVYLREHDFSGTYEVAEETQALVVSAVDQFHLFTSEVVQVVKVARTIALMEGVEDRLEVHHVAEALQYKALRQKTART